MQHVYLLQEIDFDGKSPTGLYKIGKTAKTVQSRKRQYQAGNARRVDTLHTIRVTNSQVVETDLHRRFQSYRIHHGGGDEWFYFGNVNIGNVIACMDEYDEMRIYATSHYFSEDDYDEDDYEPSYDSYASEEDEYASSPGIVIAVLVCLSLLFGGVFMSHTPQATSARIEVPASTGYNAAYLRSSPKFGDEFIIRNVKTGERLIVKTGEQVTAYGISPDGQWRRIKLKDGKSGWVSNNFVK